LIVATALTGLVGGALIVLIEHTLLRGAAHAQVEDLFNHLELIAPALAAGGVLICLAGWWSSRGRPQQSGHEKLSLPQASLIGLMQGFSLPFRGFSRSGATISAGLLLGVSRVRAEAFSFALAVVLTPPVIAREALRLLHAERAAGGGDLSTVAGRCVLGALLAFLAGLLALRWLSRWLENGRWYLFGIYCLVAAAAVGMLYHLGY
jgi:undecaprenyl-diphosphatase